MENLINDDGIDPLESNEEMYNDFFKQYDVIAPTNTEKNYQLNTVEDLFDEENIANIFDGVFAIKGFDSIVQNEFEAKLYAEISTDDRNWFFAGSKEMFIELFRNSCRIFRPNDLPSVNFKKVSFFSIDSYSKVEILFFYRKYQEWIKWNEQIGYTAYLKLVSEHDFSLSSIADSLGKLYYLIEMFIQYYTDIDNRLYPIPEENQELTIETKKDTDSNDEKFAKVLDIIQFLRAGKKGNESYYMTLQDFNRLSGYFQQLVYNGVVLFDEDEPQYRINNLNKRDIVYTHYLVNKFLYDRKRNNNIYKILAQCESAFDDLHKAIKNRTLKHHTAYKDFGLHTLDYVEHNPKHFPQN